VIETIAIKGSILHPVDALPNTEGLDTINNADAHTLDEMFRERVRRSPNKVAYRQFDNESAEWQAVSWGQIAAQVERWQVAFRESGLEKGDRVAICYRNSVEWVVFDQAALRLGLVVVPICSFDRPGNIDYILDHSGAKLVLFEQASTWDEVVASHESVSRVETVLVFHDQRKEKVNQVKLVSTWLPEEGQHFERGLAEPDDLASIVYTSGTTGRPKGVMLSHRNILSNAYSSMRSVALTPEDQLLSFLPLSHTFERSIGYYAPMVSGCSVGFSRSIDELADDFLAIKPTALISVPRIFERILNTLLTSLDSMSPFKRLLFKAAINIGWHKFHYEQGLSRWHPKLIFHLLFDRLVAKPVRDNLGGKLNFVIVGGAPLGEDVAKVFIALGLPLLQGYGLTESSPVVSVNTLERNRPDSIGLLLRGVEVKLMDDKELWVKGDNVMMGYWRNDQATKEVIVEDGGERWLKTGDCASIDAKGFIRIIGRIKDILVLANGEKVPPAILGEGKPYLTALVVLNKTILATLCKSKGWSKADQLSPKFQKYLIEKIADQMGDFPGFAKIRKVAVCDSEWTVEEELLWLAMLVSWQNYMQGMGFISCEVKLVCVWSIIIAVPRL